MSQANELLNELTVDETEPHIIINEDRTIMVPEKLRRIAVQNDHNIETVTFDCPRYWDGIDLSAMPIYVNYVRSDGVPGTYLATNVVVDTDVINFDWVISRNVTSAVGTLLFNVCIKNADEDGYELNHWNSEINSQMYVAKSLDCVDILDELYPDIIGQILDAANDIEAALDELHNYAQSLVGGDTV